MIKGIKETWNQDSEGTIEAVAEIDSDKYHFYVEWGLGSEDYIKIKKNEEEVETLYFIFNKWTDPEKAKWVFDILDSLEEGEI